MRLSQVYAYLQEPTKPTGDRLLLYTHLQVTPVLEKARRRQRRAKGDPTR